MIGEIRIQTQISDPKLTVSPVRVALEQKTQGRQPPPLFAQQDNGREEREGEREGRKKGGSKGGKE